MKIAMILILSFGVLQTSIWNTDLKVAEKEASENNKMILLNFSGSDWCGPCIKLRTEVFESNVIQCFSRKWLVLVNADFPRLKKNRLEKEQTAKNESLAETYNPQGHFPLTLLLNKNGKIVKTWEGFPDGTPGEFVSEIKKYIDSAN